MLRADLVERAHDGSLKQAPDALDAVGVNVSDDPLLRRVIDRPVDRVVVFDSDVGAELVGVDGLGLVPDVALDEPVERLLADVGDAFESDLAVPLDRTGNPGLARPLCAYDDETPGLVEIRL